MNAEIAREIKDAKIAFLANNATPKYANTARAPILTFAAIKSGRIDLRSFFFPRPAKNFYSQSFFLNHLQIITQKKIEGHFLYLQF